MPPPVSAVLLADAFRYAGSTERRAFWSAFFRHPGFRFTFFLRKVAAAGESRGPLAAVPYWFYRYWLHHYRFRYGFDISPRTRIGPGFLLGHFGGVVISPHAVIGSNVNMAHGTTVGETSRGARKGAPTLEDRVWVGAHAILVGRITVGHDSLIAPGAYVNFDVPPHSVVLGNPGKIVSQRGSAGYINNVLHGPVPGTTQPPAPEGAPDDTGQG